VYRFDNQVTNFIKWCPFVGLIAAQLLKKCSAFYKTRRLIMLLTEPYNWTLFWPEESSLNLQTLMSLRPFLILSYHLSEGLLNGLFPSGFSVTIFYAYIISPVSATCIVHFIFLDLITPKMFSEEYKLWMSSLCIFHKPPVTSSLSRPNVLFSFKFSDTLTLFFCSCGKPSFTPWEAKINLIM
jgi:hypothetical protein